jgi:uncharacterized LabA/DUF88 family protein
VSSPTTRAIVFIDGANLYHALKAIGGAIDTAYLVSGDADFLPAVAIVRSMGKRVSVASPDVSARLIRAADAAIRLDATWFADCGG